MSVLLEATDLRRHYQVRAGNGLFATKATLRIISLETEKVSMVDGLLVPERLRERIRATGPTAPVLDRQHLYEDGHVSI